MFAILDSVLISAHTFLDSIGKGPSLCARCGAEGDSHIDTVLCSEGSH